MSKQPIPKPNEAPHLWVPIMKACEMVGVSRRTIYNWLAKGRLVTERTSGGAVRIYAPSLWQQTGSHEA